MSDLGTTDVTISTIRASNGVEVTSPESQTELKIEMVSRRVDIQVTGGPPGGKGDRGERGADGIGSPNYDPGDFTLYFDNALF